MFKKLLIIIFIVSIVILIFDVIYYHFYIKKAIKSPTLSTVSQKINSSISTKFSEQNMFGIRGSDLYPITSLDVDSLATISGISNRYKDTSLGGIITGKYSKINDTYLQIIQGKTEQAVYFHTNLTLYIKTGDRVRIIEINIPQDINKFNQYAKPGDEIMLANVTKNNFGQLNSNKIIVFK